MADDFLPVPPPRPAIPSSAKPAERTPLSPELQQAQEDNKPPATRNRKKGGKKRPSRKRAPPAAAEAPKNPNRPLEMKNRLAVVLEMARVLRKPDLVVFTDLMDRLQALHRGARKKVLDGLNRVFG